MVKISTKWWNLAQSPMVIFGTGIFLHLATKKTTQPPLVSLDKKIVLAITIEQNNIHKFTVCL